MDWVIHYIHNTGTKFWSFCRVLAYQSSINTHSCLHFTTATWTPLYLAEYSFTVSLIRITIRNTHTHTHTHLLFISRNTIFLKIIYLLIVMGLSMFFSSENDVIHHHSSPYASVDCTLSLGTPSTRLCNDDDDRRFSTHTSNNISNALGSWDFLHGGKKAGGGGGNNLGARRCANCDTTSTPLWRNGPSGPKVYNM